MCVCFIDLGSLLILLWFCIQVHQRYSNNINLNGVDIDPFFGPLNAGLDDDNVIADQLYKSNVSSVDERRESLKHKIAERKVGRKDAALRQSASAKKAKEEAPGASGSGSLGQCPAGPEVKTRQSVDGQSSKDMCSAEEAIHHGQSRPSDAPEEEKDQVSSTHTLAPRPFSYSFLLSLF